MLLNCIGELGNWGTCIHGHHLQYVYASRTMPSIVSLAQVYTGIIPCWSLQLNFKLVVQNSAQLVVLP